MTTLSRDLDKAREEWKIAKKEKRETSVDGDEGAFLADLTAAGELMPEAHLRALVDVYCARHRVRLVPE